MPETKIVEQIPERPYFIALTKPQVELLLACLDIASNSGMEQPESGQLENIITTINEQTGII